MARKTKYASQLTPENYIYAPKNSFPANFERLKTDVNRCFLVVLDDHQINSLLFFYHLAHYHHLWGFPRKILWTETQAQQWDQIDAFIAETEYCLMSGCEVKDIVKVLRMIGAGIVGETLDLTDEENLIPDFVDYTETGLVPSTNYIGNGVWALQLEAIAMVAAQGFIASNIGTVNDTLNESFNIAEEGGLPNNINERLRNLNITIGGLIDGVDLIGIAENLNELKNIRKALEVSLDDGEGGVAVTDLAAVANRIAVTLDRLRDNLDVVSDDSKEFGLAAILHYYGAESIEKIDKIRDNLDAYIASEDKEFGIAALLDGITRLSFTSSEYLRCIAQAMSNICPPGVEPPILPFALIEGKGQDDDWIAEIERIRDEHIAFDSDEGRDELEDDLPDFDFSQIGTGVGLLLGISASYEEPSETNVLPYVAVQIQASGRIERVFVWATGGYRSEHSIVADEFESPVVYRFNIYQTILYELPATGTVYVEDLENEDTFFANWS